MEISSHCYAPSSNGSFKHPAFRQTRQRWELWAVSAGAEETTESTKEVFWETWDAGPRESWIAGPNSKLAVYPQHTLAPRNTIRQSLG